MPQKQKSTVLGFESLHPHNESLQQSQVFRFIDNYGGMTGANIKYRKPKIYRGKGKWYVYYSYRQADGSWKRYRVYEDINRIKTLEYAEHLRKAVLYALESGYDPTAQDRLIEQEFLGNVQMDISRALQKFLDLKKGTVKRPTYLDYERASIYLLEYLKERKMLNAHPDEITSELIYEFLNQYKTNLNWGNRTYNNYVNSLRSAFIFMRKRKYCQSNPITDIDKLKSMPKKHRFYDDGLLTRIKDCMEKHDPYLEFACQAVYFLCIRSYEELSRLKVKDIYVQRMQVFISDGKTGDRFIPLASEMLDLFKKWRVLDADPNYYVFSPQHRGNHLLAGRPGLKRFNVNYFAKRFKKIRELLDLSSDYTIYGFKHTRVIHLKMDGVSDADIMSLTGHTDFASYAKYLRDIGMTSTPAQLENKTRNW